MSEEDGGYVYVATAQCGCRVAVCSEAMPAKDRAKHVADYMRRGFTVEREHISTFRTTPFGHFCGKKPQGVKPKPRTEQLT